MFPAWLEHPVAKSDSEGERISIAFNVMLSDYAEEFNPPRWSRRPSA